MGDRASLGELADKGLLQLSDGYRTRASELGSHGLPILRAAEVLHGRIEPSLKDHVHAEHRGRMGIKVSSAGDVVVTTKGTVGRVAMIPAGAPEFVYSPQLCFFRVMDQSKIDLWWLYSWFRSPEFERQARIVAGQTDMAPYISLADIRRIGIRLPEPEAQHRIGHAIRSLDERVTVAGRTTRAASDLAAGLLEAASCDTKLVSLTEVAEVRKGLSYKGAGLAQSGMPMVNLANAATFGGFKRDGFKYYTGDYKPRHVARGGDLLVANTDLTWKLEALGWPMLLPEDVPEALFSHHVSIIDFRPEWRHLRLPVWAHLFTREARQRIEGMAHGTTVAALPVEALTWLEVPLLPADSPVIADAEALLRRAWAAERESAALARLRDALLPPLMSGEQRVRDAEDVVADAGV